MAADDMPAAWRLEGVHLCARPGQPMVRGAIEVSDGCIAAVGRDLPPAGPQVMCLDRSDLVVLPGWIQGHIHLCQTLFRGLAEGRPLDRWLRECIWPLEAVHDADSMRAAARLGIAEGLLHGTTTFVDMGSVHHTDVLAAEAEALGVRAILGKALMDVGADVPRALSQDRHTALREALALHARWHGAAGGRLQIALAPRFTVSVSQELWRELAAAALERGILVHTHLSETPWENETCRQMHGASPLEVLERWGVLAARVALAHAIWIDERDRAMLRDHGTGVIHCPGSNAKLGSGVADIAALLAEGIAVGLGSDGAACNDALSPLAEMRTAAQVQSLHFGPGRVTAEAILGMATELGARAVGIGTEVGSLAPGKRADLALYRLADIGWEEDLPLAHSLVYAAPGVRAREVYVDGRRCVSDGKLVGADWPEIRRAASAARARLLERARI